MGPALGAGGLEPADVGITLGSFWAYYELGWGGWWFWDPVENAIFMPWLVAHRPAALGDRHEKRGALAGWTLFLSLAAFSFSMLGAVPGALGRAHLGACLCGRSQARRAAADHPGAHHGAGFSLFRVAAPKLAQGGLFAPVSRESALVLNNILLAAATTTVLLGTLYPLIREAMTGEAISVGPPYFNLTFTPLMATLAILLPAGPLLAWKRGDAQGVAQRLWIAALIALGVALLAYAIVSPRKAFGAAGIGMGSWLIAGAIAELVERTRLFRISAGESLRRLVGLPRGAWGMTLAHLGLGVFVLGACFETGWKAESAETLRVGNRWMLAPIT
jgi:cytochrome c-type biogenesis protein CcmF